MQSIMRPNTRPFTAHATRLGSRQASSLARPVRARAAVQASAQLQQQQSQSQSQQNATRRQLLSSLVAVGAAAGFMAPQPAMATAPTCELTSSPSGLQFCDLKVGEGAEPVKGALIRCHYTGRLASNGRVFDSSYERGRPLTFKVGVHEVITGWDLGILGTEGVPPMKEGGKRLLLIPSDLAYGSRGAGGVIPPNAQLEFEVELLGKRR